ncbi:MAG: hydroxyacylglutathione hydrolase [Cellvibrionaceae bacterium]
MKKIPIEQLSPNLWVQQSAWFDINSGIFVSQNQALLIDPGLSPNEVDSISNFVIEKGWEIAGIYLTHWHWDHIMGPERLPNVPVYGPPFYDEVFEAENQNRTLTALAHWEKDAGISRTTPFVIPKPDKIFTNNDTLTVGDAELQIVHVPGHCKGQAALFEKNSGLFWSADNLINFEVPFVFHSCEAFIQSLEHLKTLDIRHLVPGHANPTQDSAEINTRFSNSLSYLYELKALVTQALADGLNGAETIAQGLEKMPITNRDALGPHRINIGQAYLEFGGEAGTKKLGW